jgi:hypothetical protein
MAVSSRKQCVFDDVATAMPCGGDRPGSEVIWTKDAELEEGAKPQRKTIVSSGHGAQHKISIVKLESRWRSRDVTMAVSSFVQFVSDDEDSTMISNGDRPRSEVFCLQSSARTKKGMPVRPQQPKSDAQGRERG